MDFRPSTEQELFRKAVREFAEKKVMPRAREIDEKEAGIPDEIIAEMAELGIFGVTIPEEYGGSAQPNEGLQYARIAIEELGRAELSMSLPVYTLLCLGWSYLVISHGTEQLKRSLLPKVASGANFLGICTTEPSGGSDLAGIKTTARREGDKYILNGEKVYISGVVEAMQRGGGHLVLFRTDPEKGTRGMTFAYVPTNSPGVSYTTFRDMGRGGLSTGGLRFKDVEVPVENVLGQENRGFYVLMEGFNAARVLVSAACVGAADRALEMSRDYTQKRVLFGIPLIKNEGISFDIADGRARLEMLKLSLQKASWMIDQFYKDRSFTQKEINEIVAICKLTAPLLALEIVRNAMIHHGAYGYTKDCDLEMAFRGLMSYVVGAEGGANIMRLIIAREYVGDIAIPYR
jgi:acyl-CoA dehydrogenase